MIDVDQAGDLPDGGTMALQLIGMNDLWNSLFTQQPCRKGLLGLGIAVTLGEDQARNRVQMPPGILTGCPVASFFSEEGYECDTPGSEGLVTDSKAALVAKILPVPQGKAAMELPGACRMMVTENRWREGLASVTAGQPIPTR